MLRLVDLLNHPQDIPFLSGLTQREIIYQSSGDVRGRAFGRLQPLGIRATGRQKRLRGSGPNYAKPLRIEDLAKIAGMGVSTLHHISGR